MAKNRAKRRWLQFRLRTLLIAVLVLSLPLSWFAVRMERARRQREAVQAIVKAGGRVFYDYQGDNTEDAFDPSAKSPNPNWVRALLGDDFLSDATAVFGDENFGDSEASNLNSLTGITGLYLENAKITDAGVEHVKGLDKLLYLELRYTEITDAGLKHLERLTNLRYLSLCNTQVTDAGVRNITRLTNLEGLDLKHTHITEDGLKKLQEALPNCKIRY